jgi:hypothetical protein
MTSEPFARLRQLLRTEIESAKNARDYWFNEGMKLNGDGKQRAIQMFNFCDGKWGGFRESLKLLDQAATPSSDALLKGDEKK